ncbi:hypothetical protein P170DRAFT_479769 [Aspergillus steynii IBT 23096]|uniref:Uncharacterized protein n=1 Tax=Aspergillus steynii IBT 23096 TaxID=1392250 RepID=A0A2I2FX85_9EURO|nr:uncharacterized protein P170DRAFT_479769 [Aspergillus steynii IBT 23096]PLB45251.1 hypothetical protein P170DRAFT_479769 [Aspergillus steynii IBT 23096]
MAHSSQHRASRRSRPVRSSRTQVQSYHEASSSDEHPDEDNLASDEERPSLSLRPRDSHRAPVSYREDSTDNSSEGSIPEDPEAVIPVETPTQFTSPFPEPAGRSSSTQTRPSRRQTVKTRSQTKGTKRSTGKRHLELGRSLKKKRKVETDEPPFVGSGVIPPWQTLPYHVLFDIFFFASYPLLEEKATRRHSSVQWLVNVSLLCHAFNEPALAVLYQCPPLLPAAKTHSLLTLLSCPQQSLSTNYANKIRELHVDVETLLLYKSGPTLGYFELPRLIEKTPQVKRLRLYHSDDYMVGLPAWQITRSKWIYPDSLFSAIESASMRLRSWDWNSRFMETKRLLPLMMAKHLQPAFQNITELRLLHIACEDMYGDESCSESDEREVVLATALKGLPHLRHLEFQECSIINEYLMPNLPTGLVSLTINNCDDVTTANFSAFIATHGQHLRELTLSHNRHLSLSFIVILAQACQSLEKFKMDISMHDWSSYHDVEPHFRELLSPSEVPTWPSTLQEIELVQLRKWDDRTAGVFFTSLIDAAPELRDLRRLMISAILKIGWRDRASFREKWIGNLEKVFLRRSAPPNPAFRTLARTAPSTTHVDEGKTDEAATQSDAPPSGISTPSKRKSARLAQRKLSEVEINTDQSPLSRTASEGDDDQRRLPVQGMCDVVSVRIDNQRPTETQFNEEDFLDDELSGDEDWNGNDVDIGDTSHAW